MSNADARQKEGWRRHLAGWQGGALLATFAWMAASLAVPRATLPYVLPVPPHDGSRARQADEEERERAAAVHKAPLPHPVRVIGETFRRLNLAMVEDPSQAHRLRRELHRDVQKHLAPESVEPLLRLRALQGELFVHAAREWERSGAPSSELRELGGDFLEKASWWRGVVEHAPGPLVFSDQELRLLFRVRWGTLTGTHRKQPFGPNLNEVRHYYAILLRHPVGETSYDRVQNQLAAVDALARIDSSYPGAFARGVLWARLGDTNTAARHFEAYARSHSDGPWLLLARNHWLAQRAPAD